MRLKRLSPLLVSGLSAALLIASIGVPVSAAPADRPAADACSDPNSSSCLAAMQANAAPAVSDVPVDRQEVGAYSFYKVQPNTLLYDAPNGAVVGIMPNGFNFVIVYDQQQGFAKLRNGQWVERSSLKHTYASSFAGVTFNQSLPYPMAWVIQASIPSASPGAANSPKTPAINRYTRVYIYQTVHVGQWDWYLVGPGQWLEQRKVARVVPVSKPDGATDKWVSVNLYEQVATAYEGNTPVFATLISSGLPNWQTDVGTFNVWHRADLTPMSGAMGAPDEYSLPAVPYVMFFDNDISLHGTYWHDGFGYKHSHGCVNMSIADAKWIYNWSSDSPTMTVQVVSGKPDGSS